MNQTFSEIPEELVSKYVLLNEKAKEIEKELKEMKKVINVYFDAAVGKNEKAESIIGSYKIQRQVRSTENYEDEKMVKRLEDLQLNDCVQMVKMPDQQKIEAAITLGLLGQNDIEDCIIKKMTPVIVVRKI
ncbi:hypothetical protein [Fredinandcohnia quinoae]|uniref:Inhibitor of growth protein N-terminal histone-binding domain-containing protein n=1 Tax=Fredinandcohnia quinoae TaxID=2918902 RepID=A0AAW5EA82_9BACI|nr:hypothetical protein [Fredinandcohnia sp. SECRCQ15]MCH1626321.1 hypothetical protein [Fredinandcohnia sp. SECRCQ15]